MAVTKNQDTLLVIGNGGPGPAITNTQNVLDYGTIPGESVDAIQSNTQVITNPADIFSQAGNTITASLDGGDVNAAQNIWGGARSYQGSVAQLFENDILLGDEGAIDTATTSQAIHGDAFSDTEDAAQLFANVLEAPTIADADSGQLLQASIHAPGLAAQGALNSLFDEDGQSVGDFAQQLDLTSVAGTSVQAAWNRAGVGYGSNVAQALNSAVDAKTILQNFDNDARFNGDFADSSVVQLTNVIDIGTGGGSVDLNSWQTINGDLNSLDTQQRNWARVVGQYTGIDVTLVNEETAVPKLDEWVNVPGMADLTIK